MKQNLRQAISLLLCMVMLVGMVPVSYGETIEQTDGIENTIQVIELAQECVEQQLTSNEVAAYQEIATALQEQTKVETPSVRVTNQDETTVYTLGESTEENQIVIQATTSKNNTEAAVAVTVYEEIVITTETAETEAIAVSEEPTEAPESAEALETEAVNSPKETSEIPEATEVAETEAMTASDEITEVAENEEVPEAEAAVSPEDATEIPETTEVAETEVMVASEEATEAPESAEALETEAANSPKETSEIPEATEVAETEAMTASDEITEVAENEEVPEAEAAVSPEDATETPEPTEAAGTEEVTSSEEAKETPETTENAETEATTVAEEVTEAPEASLELTDAAGTPADADKLNPLDPFAQTEFENEYKNTVTTVITAEELLTKVESGDGFSIAFANKLGFGKNAKEISKNLKAIVDEYNEQINKGVNFEKPRFIINGVDITANRKVEELKLTLQPDGTYTASLTGTETGYRTSVLIDAEASVTIIYDEKGETKIERKVKSGKPTDFVIALDISGSMKDYGRDKAMLSALKVVLDEILAVEENTVSIVFWAKNGAEMRVKVDGKGIISTFSGKDGLTADSVFDAKLVSSTGGESNFSLSDATISRLESLYQTDSGTEPDKGLATALNILENIEKSPDRKVGVMMFTDGAANYTSSERETVNLEKKIAEDYGATIVNVSIGDEYDVKNYERYLDPKSDTYYQKGDKVLEKQVIYYNIPKLTDQELADRVSEIFEVAFEDIVTETKKLQTETITDGVLAAYSAKLIETIPAGFELIEYRDETGFTNHKISGKDEQGNTTITFDLEDIVSGKDQVVSYCVIPTKADNDIGVVAYADKSETVLVAEPVDRLEAPKGKQKVSITATRKKDAPVLKPEHTHDKFTHRDLRPNHTHEYTTLTSVNSYVHRDDQSHFIIPYVQKVCRICGMKKTLLHSNTSYTFSAHKFNNEGICTLCQFSLRDRYRDMVKAILDGNDPFETEQNFEEVLKLRLLIAHGMTEQIAESIITTVKNAEKKYRDLYLLSLVAYGFETTDENPLRTSYYSPEGNKIVMWTSDETPQSFLHTWFHESGHAIEGNLSGEHAAWKEEQIEDNEYAILKDVRSRIVSTISSHKKNSKIDAATRETIIDEIMSANNVPTYKKNWLGGYDRVYSIPESLSDSTDASKIYKDTCKSIYDSVKQAMSNANGNSCMVADIYGGATNNKFGYGHGAPDDSRPAAQGYWFDDDGNRTDSLTSEAWAEFFSGKMIGESNGYQGDRMNRTWLQNAYRELEDYADRMLVYYEGLLRNQH